tara:strand:+ start:175 stop:357 length:183 start_codon:yes stop_codon:yes gene_type:complete
MVIAWNTGLAAERARYNLKLKNKKNKKPQATSRKRQASSIFPSGYVNWFKKKMDKDFKIG